MTLFSAVTIGANARAKAGWDRPSGRADVVIAVAHLGSSIGYAGESVDGHKIEAPAYIGSGGPNRKFVGR